MPSHRLALSLLARFLAVALALAATLAVAETRVRVIETHPPTPATLGHWEHFYIRIAYESDRPVRVRAHAYADGKQVDEMTSGSPLHTPGPGEALFWFAWTKPGRVDRIMVYAQHEGTSKPVAQAELAVQLTTTGQKGAAAGARPQWVTDLLAKQNRMIKEAIKREMDRPTPWWHIVLFQLVMLSIPTYFILQGVLLWRWRGGWRIAAGIPGVIMGLLLVHAIFALFAGSNIWPILLVFTAPPALLYLLVLIALRARSARREAEAVGRKA